MQADEKAKIIHRLFDVALVAKAIDGLLEIVGAILLFVATSHQIRGLANILTQGELREDPDDFVATHLLRASQHIASNAKAFAVVFLLLHGVIKVGLVWALLRRHLWAYPIAIGTFSLFIAYQFYRYSHTHSVWLIALSVIDLFVIVITWLEYNRLRAENRSNKAAT